jgi:hypothetical protein
MKDVTFNSVFLVYEIALCLLKLYCRTQLKFTLVAEDIMTAIERQF